MSNYVLNGNGSKFFDYFGSYEAPFNIGAVIFYATPTEFGIHNADGSNTYFHGTDFSFDWTSKSFTSGAITSIVRYKGGVLLDSLTGYGQPATFLNSPYYFVNFGSEALYTDDFIDARNRTAAVSLSGGLGNDTIYGGSGADTLSGDAGNDIVVGYNGNDSVSGGDGDDFVYGGNGNDRLFGGAGNDYAHGGEGADILNGGAGDDTLLGGGGNDILYGNGGSNSVDGGLNTDTAVFAVGRAQSYVEKTSTGFKVHTAAGVDSLVGVERIAFDDGTYSYNAAKNAWTRINTVSGAELANPAGVKTGTAGDDALVSVAGDGPVVLKGLAGNDTLTTLSPDSLILGGAGNDTIIANFGGYLGNHRAYGGDGDDTITIEGQQSIAFGGSGNDVLTGALNATLVGDEGNDIITGDGKSYGGAGDDTLIFNNGIQSGGIGADTFKFQAIAYNQFGFKLYSFGVATVSDFEVGTDKFTVQKVNFDGSEVIGYSLSQTQTGYELDFTLNGNITSGHVYFEGITQPGLTVADFVI